MRFQIWTFYIAEVYSNPKIVFHFESPKKKQWSLICGQSFMDTDSKCSLFFSLYLFLNGFYPDFFIIKVLFSLNSWH